MEPGDSLHLRGFGTFECNTTPEREARNPKKNVPVMIPKRARLKFVPTRSIKEVYDNYFIRKG
jgi:nucleoid DNA-binding protein